MPELTLPLIAVLGPFPINHWLERQLPRRRGEMRPSTIWLAIAATLTIVSGLLMMRSAEMAGLNLLAAISLTAAGAAVIYYFHRRVIFGAQGVYHWRFGQLRQFCAYRDIHRCELGADVASRALEIESRYGTVVAAPGFVDKRQIEDALRQLHRARVRLPDADALKSRLGIDLASIL